MDIKNISQLKTLVGAGANLSKEPEGPTFVETLKDSIKKVDNLNKSAESAILELGSGKSKNIHETMLAIEKADISFRMMMQVRNKIVDAYQEVMRMSV